MLIYHYPLCPFSRQIRVILNETKTNYNLVEENYWLRRPEFLKLNPEGTLPVLCYETICFSSIFAILEYVCSKFLTNHHLTPKSLEEKCKILESISWFNNKFYFEITKNLLSERLVNLLTNSKSPNSKLLLQSEKSLHKHMEYMSNLLSKHQYIYDDVITIVDIVSASHISVIDYFNYINWNKYSIVKEWYCLIKSRPSFKPILNDKISAILPPNHYNQLDF